MTDFSLMAEARDVHGRRPSRRLRREDRVPAVIYGGGEAAQSISLSQREISRLIQDQSVFSHVITLNITDRASQQVIIRDLQMHPYKALVQHVDFQRAKAGQKVTVHVPINYVGEAECIGARLQGGQLHHILVELEVQAPSDKLPDHIDIDVSGLEKGQSVHLSDIKLPEGVSIIALAHGDDKAVVQVLAPRGAAAEESEAAEA